MSEERYAILFSSVTGNTKELADVIRETLPEEKCDFFGGVENQEPTADMLYIGFWTDKGNADQATIQLLQKLKNKKVFLFGTAGFGGSEAYFRKILERVRQSGREQYGCRGIHVSGQNAADRERTLCEDEGAAGAYEESGCAH